MIEQALQVALMVGTTYLVRALGRWMGPQRGGLMMGVPTTTALLLVSYGLRGGIGEACLVAESCLIGLLAAGTLPIAYSRAAAAGWRWPGAAAGSIGAYFFTAILLAMMPRDGVGWTVFTAASGMALLCHLARRSLTLVNEDHVAELSQTPRVVRPALSWRSVFPFVYFSTLQYLRSCAGAGLSGRFVTFPGASLAVLVTTHQESGAGVACRTAAAMPFGGLGMLGFLTAFRFGSPVLGLGWGTALGYVAALVVLGTANILNARVPSISVPEWVRKASRWGPRQAFAAPSLRLVRSEVITWKGHTTARPGLSLKGRMVAGRRGFSPRIETLAA